MLRERHDDHSAENNFCHMKLEFLTTTGVVKEILSAIFKWIFLTSYCMSQKSTRQQKTPHLQMVCQTVS